MILIHMLTVVAFFVGAGCWMPRCSESSVRFTWMVVLWAEGLMFAAVQLNEAGTLGLPGMLGTAFIGLQISFGTREYVTEKKNVQPRYAAA